MDDQRPTTPQPTTAKAPPSRGLVVAAVALLIIVAVAGIVLARKNSSPMVAAGAASGAASGGSTSPALSGPTSGPNEVVFETGSAKLPALANDSIVKFSETARGAPGMVRLTTRFPSGANKDKDFALAKERTAAVHHALEANGIKSENIQGELIEMAAGSVKPRDADRVELSLH